MKLIFTPRSKVFISIGFGLLGALLCRMYLEIQEKKLKAHYQMTTVLVAKKYIKEGKTVGLDLVEEVAIPQVYLQPTALQKKEELKNQRGDVLFSARIGILKGEQLTKSKLTESGDLRTLAWTLPPGQTAVSFRLAPEQAVGGHLHPGDSVNVYCTINQQPGWPKDRTSLLLQRVLVVAVENIIWDPAVPYSQKTVERTTSPEAVFITLALSPGDAGRMIMASEKGKMVLALASPLESQIYSVHPLELINLQ